MALRKDDVSCSVTCAVALHSILNHGVEPDENLTPEQRIEVDEKIDIARGRTGIDVVGKITRSKAVLLKADQSPELPPPAGLKEGQ